MKIAFVLPSLANKGPIIVAKDLCEEYVSSGHECIIYYFNDIYELTMPCTVVKISFNQPFDFSKWDIIHSHCFMPDMYVGYHHKKIKQGNCLCVTTLHNPISFRGLQDNYNILKRLLLSIGWKWCLSHFDKIVVLNKYLKSKILFINDSKIEVIFNGRNVLLNAEYNNEDRCIIEQILKLKKNYKIIGTVSSIDRRKNIIQIIRALPSLSEFAYVAVGDGPQLTELKKLAESLNVSDRCIWVGYTPNAINYYQYMDIFVMCSKSEGFPLAFIEAAAWGKPVVLSDIPILKSIATKQEVCYYHLDDNDSFIENIHKADANSESLNFNIKKYYQTFLTKKIMANKYLALYNKMEDNKGE